MTFTTESLLESTSAGFGIETLSPLQRAKARILDGLPLGELAERDDVREMLGTDPRELPAARPVETLDAAAIRSLKTITCAAKCIELADHVDTAGLRHGEVPRIAWLSETMEAARPGFDVLVGTLTSRKALRPLVVSGPTKDSITLRNRSGWPVEIKIVPFDRAGVSLVGRWFGGLIVDEVFRMQTAESGHVVNLEDSRTAVRGRLLPDGQIIYIGSPWAPEGWPFKMFEERFGKPGSDFVVMRATGPALNPQLWTPERCAEVKAASPRTYLMDVMAEFGAAETNAYDLEDVRASALRRLPVGRVRIARGMRVLACDPSKLLGLNPDRWAYAVLGWDAALDARIPVLASPPPRSGLSPDVYVGIARDEHGCEIYQDVDRRPVLRVDECAAWSARGVSFDEIASRLTDVCRRHAIQIAAMDYGGDTQALMSLFRRLGVRCEAFPWTEKQRGSGFEFIGRLLQDRRIEIPDEAMRRDLMRVHAVLRPNGTVTYQARRTAEGHADLASCLVTYAIAENEGLLHDSPINAHGARHVAAAR